MQIETKEVSRATIKDVSAEELEMMRKILFDTKFGYVSSNDVSEDDFKIIDKLLDSNHMEADLAAMGGGHADFSLYPTEFCETELCERFNKVIKRCTECHGQLVFDTSNEKTERIKSITCCDIEQSYYRSDCEECSHYPASNECMGCMNGV